MTETVIIERPELPDTVFAWIDGSADPDSGVGGVAAVLVYKGSHKVFKHFVERVDAERAEILAAIFALSRLKKACNVVLYSDSETLVHTMLGKRTKRSNLDAWNRLEKEVSRQTSVCWKWVKGHSGNPNNELAHTLAKRVMQSGRPESKDKRKRNGRSHYRNHHPKIRNSTEN